MWLDSLKSYKIPLFSSLFLRKNNLKLFLEHFQNTNETCKEEKEKVVLVLNGSFSPVHQNHILILNWVKSYFEKFLSEKYVIVAGFISPVPDRTLFGKLKSDSIPYLHRLQLLKIMTKNTDWNVDDSCLISYEMIYNITSRVEEALQQQEGDRLKGKVRGMYVVGEDAAERLSQYLDEEEWMVVIERKGYQDKTQGEQQQQQQTQQQQTQKPINQRKNTITIRGWHEEQLMSSTIIRKQLAKTRRTTTRGSKTRRRRRKKTMA